MKLEKFNQIKTGNILEIKFYSNLPEKDKILKFSGILISKNNKTKSLIVRKNSFGIGVEYLFRLDSPKIFDIIIKEKIYFRKSKLFFLRNNIYKNRKKIINKF